MLTTEDVAKTPQDAFPLPHIEEYVDALHGAKYFSTIDLDSGYHQVAVDEKDRNKTAFTTPFRLNGSSCLPFGVVQWSCHISETNAGDNE